MVTSESSSNAASPTAPGISVGGLTAVQHPPEAGVAGDVQAEIDGLVHVEAELLGSKAGASPAPAGTPLPRR